MNRRFLGGAIGLAALILADCGQTTVEDAQTVLFVGDLQTARLHFSTFMKSKSGAT